MSLTLDLPWNLFLVLTLTLALCKLRNERSLRCIVLTADGGIVLQPSWVEEVVGCIHTHGITVLQLSGIAIVHCWHTSSSTGCLEHVDGRCRLSVLVRWMGPPAATRRGVVRRFHHHLLLLIAVWVGNMCCIALNLTLLLLLLLLLLVLHLTNPANAAGAGTQEQFETPSQLIVAKGVFLVTSIPPIGTDRSMTVVGIVDVLDGIGPGPAGRGSIIITVGTHVVLSVVATAATTVLVPRPSSTLLVIGRRSRRGLARFVPAHGAGRLVGAVMAVMAPPEVSDSKKNDTDCGHAREIRRTHACTAARRKSAKQNRIGSRACK